MQITKHQKPLVRRGKIIPLVNAKPTVGMSTACFIRAIRLHNPALSGAMHNRSRKVSVVGNRFNIIKRKRFKVLSRLALIPGPRQNVIKVRNHTGGDKHFAMVIKI